MNKKAIYDQKLELEKLQQESYIERDQLEQSRKTLQNSLIKVISGPRRAGKSVFARELLKGQKFGYINFDDEELISGFSYPDLISGLTEFYGQTKFLLFDEIQNLPDWELVVNKLHRRGYNLVLTGSNSHLLSRELATHLTGRHISTALLPFSWKEFLKAKEHEEEKNSVIAESASREKALFRQYLTCGGFPEIVLLQNELVSYLTALFDSILLNDIIRRKKIRYQQLILDLADFLLSSYACQITSRSIKNKLGTGSVTTIENYSKSLEEAYLITFLPRYSFKIGISLKASKKVYVIDNGYITAKVPQFSINEGRMLENLIFIEIIRLGFNPGQTLFYYQTRNGREVDFVLRQGIVTIKLIQVCFELNQENIKRETKALEEAGEELHCRNLQIITANNYIKEKIRDIEIIDVIDFFKT